MNRSIAWGIAFLIQQFAQVGLCQDCISHEFAKKTQNTES